MEESLFWLCFKDGSTCELSRYRAESRHDALRHGMEHVLDRELVADFSDNLNLTHEQMLKLAPYLPPPGSAMWRSPEAEQKKRPGDSSRASWLTGLRSGGLVLKQLPSLP